MILSQKSVQMSAWASREQLSRIGVCSANRTKGNSASGGLSSHQKHPERVLVPGRWIRKWKSSASRLTRERRAEVAARSATEDDRSPLSRSEVVELLLLAVNTLLKEDNYKLLRSHFLKSKQQKESSKVVEFSSSHVPISSLQLVDRTRCSEVVERESRLVIDLSDQIETTSSEDKQGTCNVPSEYILESEGQFITCGTKSNITGHPENEEDPSSLTSDRRLKMLNVHSYVHTALRESALRSWLHSRKVED